VKEWTNKRYSDRGESNGRRGGREERENKKKKKKKKEEKESSAQDQRCTMEEKSMNGWTGSTRNPVR
jgi:hypothetical protein